MKNFITIFLVFFGFSILEFDAQSVGGFQRLDLTILGAQLNITENPFVKVYGIDAPAELYLPITPDEIQTYVHIDYLTPTVYGSKNPVWKNQFGFTRSEFNEKSLIVVELWNQIADAVEQLYRGGAQITIADLQKSPKSFNLVMKGQDGRLPGLVTIAWNN